MPSQGADKVWSMALSALRSSSPHPGLEARTGAAPPIPKGSPTLSMALLGLPESW